MRTYQSSRNISLSISLYSDKLMSCLSPFTQSKTPKKIENVFIFLVPSSEPCEKLLPIHPAKLPESDTTPKLITLPRPSRAGTPALITVFPLPQYNSPPQIPGEFLTALGPLTPVSPPKTTQAIKSQTPDHK